MANRPNTDEEETLPMYIPKIREEPLPVHEHPWPELDPRRIAPDGIATPRTTTERLPAFLSFVLVILLIFMAGCGPTESYPGEPTPAEESLSACLDACAALDGACGPAWTAALCEASCTDGAAQLDAACLAESAAWYSCMAEGPADLDCSNNDGPPVAASCQPMIEDYYACMAEVAS